VIFASPSQATKACIAPRPERAVMTPGSRASRDPTAVWSEDCESFMTLASKFSWNTLEQIESDPRVVRSDLGIGFRPKEGLGFE
jgi:hypothetical protein